METAQPSRAFLLSEREAYSESVYWEVFLVLWWMNPPADGLVEIVWTLWVRPLRLGHGYRSFGGNRRLGHAYSCSITFSLFDDPNTSSVPEKSSNNRDVDLSARALVPIVPPTPIYSQLLNDPRTNRI